MRVKYGFKRWNADKRGTCAGKFERAYSFREIQSGIFLSQRRLASRVDAAVVTVRAALRQLENEGLIENVPRWGVRIPLETEDSLKDRYYVREVFETEAVKQIVNKRSQLDPAKLYELAKACDRIVFDSEGNPKHFGILHYKLHCKIVEMSGSPLLTKTFEKISLKACFSGMQFTNGSMVTFTI